VRFPPNSFVDDLAETDLPTSPRLGLCYLANGSGCLLASFCNGPRMTADYKAVKRQVERKRQEEGFSAEEEEAERNRDHNDLTTFPIEHARLRSLRMSSFALFRLYLRELIPSRYLLSHVVLRPYRRYHHLRLARRQGCSPLGASHHAIHQFVSLLFRLRFLILTLHPFHSRTERHLPLQLLLHSPRRSLPRPVCFRHRRQQPLPMLVRSGWNRFHRSTDQQAGIWCASSYLVLLLCRY
jgi:hypothetical protein